MKQVLFFITLFYTVFSLAQVPAYYDDVNLTLTGTSLKTELATKIINSQTTTLSYTPGVWNALKQTDVDPSNSSRVILIYGYNDTDGVLSTDRTRGLNENGGGATEWNREHVYPKSLANLNLGTTGAGADAHNLRPADPARNSSRSSRKFAAGSGNSGITAQGHWYPGDEFKGDVARMMMFMYLRYGNRCLPVNVGVGSTVAGDANMLQLFLTWNAEDPVSTLELQRNPIIENLQGNRNPFIDNPAFATQIWGGPQAEDRFGSTPGGGNDLCNSTVTSFPYAESFESNFGNWVQATTDDFNWTRRSGNTPSSGTGPSSASAGSTYIYMESSSPNYSSKSAILYGPCYDFSGASQASATFKYHMYGSTAMGSLRLQASLDGTSWTTIWSKSGNQGNSWQTATVDLAAYAGENVQLRFNGITGTTWKGDMAIDNVQVSTTAGGAGGSTEVGVTLQLTFDNYPEETSWEIRNSSNQIVTSGGNYGSQPNGSTITITRTLDAGCYTLIFRDTYGDGICCSYGNGSYRLTADATGIVLASGGSFGSQISQNFCLTTARTAASKEDDILDDSIATASLSIFPNPVHTSLTISSIEKLVAYEVRNQLGQLVKQEKAPTKEIDVSGLSKGVYLLILDTTTQTYTKRFVKQ